MFLVWQRYEHISNTSANDATAVQKECRKNFLLICFCSAIAYAPSLMFVAMLMLMLMSHALVVRISSFCLLFYLVLMLMPLVRTRLMVAMCIL